MALAAAPGMEREVVPGVSSALAAPALAGIPPTFRNLARSFAVVTGHACSEGELDWPKLAGVDTLVILMGVANRARIAAALIGAGRSPSEPVAFVENGTLPEERVIVTSLRETAAGAVAVNSPAVMVVGEVVRLREDLAGVAETAVAMAEAPA